MRFLDLACGTGRHAVALHDGLGGVVGLDLSARLLFQARRRQGPARPFWVRSDMRQLPFRAGSFGAVVNFFTSFGYFDDLADDALVVREVTRLLAPGGAFLSDVFNAERVIGALAVREEKTVAGARVSIRRRYDPASRRVEKEIEMGSGEDKRVFRECVRAYTEHELRSLHRAAGLTVRAAYGNFDGTPFDRGRSPRLILLAVSDRAPRGRAMTTISLAHVPGIPALARGLATGAPDVSAFLPDRPELETIAQRARAVLAAFRPRTVSADTDPRLAAFARGEASAVFTGQQAGLFGGPLLTLVKALAAEKLAAHLVAQGTTAGPAFWCASEDHDLVEVTRLVLPSPDGPVDFGPDAGPLAGNRSPVGTLPVGVDVEALVAAAAAGLAQPPDEAAVAALTAAHRGKTFFEAFSATLAWLLGGSVPVLDAARRRQAGPRAARVPTRARTRTEVKRLLDERGAALEAAGHPLQVTSDPAALPLFARVGERPPSPCRDRARGSLSRDATGRSKPRRSSSASRAAPGCRLSRRSRGRSRPPALFPVAATILGPAEIAYWAQGWPLFAWAGIVPPVLVPRPMVALVPPATARVLAKLGLSVEDVLGGPEAMLRKKGAGEVRTLLERLTAIRENAIRALEAEEPALLAVDPSLEKAVLATREKRPSRSRSSSRRPPPRRGALMERTAASGESRLVDEILPGGTLAERAYSALPYVLRFGREALVGALRRELKWDDAGLQVIDL